jgi:hypothetical protein
MWLVALGYAGALVAATGLLFMRHLQELRYPIDAQGGMWAGGDLFLYVFIAGLFMVPTIFLILVTAKFEGFYTGFSKFQLVLSLSAPVCLIVVYLGENHVGEGLLNLCLFRLLWVPFILVGMGISRLAARFDRAKKLVSYALLTESLTFVIAIALFVHSWLGPKPH